MQVMAKTTETSGSRGVTISRPDKLLWPDAAVTKQDYADYLSAVAEDMLPWLHDRPVTMVRAPDGVGGQRYYQKAAPTYAPPEVGAMAPDFQLPGATRYGLLRDPVRLSDHRGKTVVLAFFYRARTKG